MDLISKEKQPIMHALDIGPVITAECVLAEIFVICGEVVHSCFKFDSAFCRTVIRHVILLELINIPSI